LGWQSMGFREPLGLPPNGHVQRTQITLEPNEEDSCSAATRLLLDRTSPDILQSLDGDAPPFHSLNLQVIAIE